MLVPDEGWFVQMPFVGTILGPMPVDALTEMVRTGALLRHDLVRRGASGEWRSASELPELSGEFSVPVPSVEATTAALDHPLSFAVAGPSAVASPGADVINVAPEPPQSLAPDSAPPSPFDFEIVTELSVAATSEVVSHNPAPSEDATSLPIPSEPTHTSLSITPGESPLDETVVADRSSWSAPASVSRPALRRNLPTKADRGPSALARFSAVLSELYALLSKPIDIRRVAAVAVLALLVWYFIPARQPVRRPPPQTAEVAGVIRLNGKPVANALVTFHPDREQGTVGPPSVGKTDAAGQFKLTINNTQPGAVVGKHQVAVLGRESAGNLTAGNLSGGSMSSQSVPERYAQVETSRLAAEVLPGQLNEITLDLTSN